MYVEKRTVRKFVRKSDPLVALENGTAQDVTVNIP